MTSLDSTDLAHELVAAGYCLTDGGSDLSANAVEARVSKLEARADELDNHLAAVESGFDSLRGLVSEAERVDKRVECRATSHSRG